MTAFCTKNGVRRKDIKIPTAAINVIKAPSQDVKRRLVGAQMHSLQWLFPDSLEPETLLSKFQ